MADATQDLNATIAAAVQARIETEVAAALAGDEYMGRFISAALTEKVRIKGTSSNGYKDRDSTFLAEALAETIKEATKRAVEQAVQQRAGEIEAAVETMVARNVKNIAKALTKQLVDTASNAYGFKIEVHYPHD